MFELARERLAVLDDGHVRSGVERALDPASVFPESAEEYALARIDHQRVPDQILDVARLAIELVGRIARSVHHAACASRSAPTKSGKLTAMAASSSIARSPAPAARIAAAIAVRWSPCVSIVAPLHRGFPPRTSSPFRAPSAWIPAAPSSRSIAAMRSDSLVRRSCTPAIFVSPSAKAAATAKTGISSM